MNPVARTLLAPFRAAQLAALSLVSALALAAAPVLLADRVFAGPPGALGDHFHLYFGLLVTVLPCLVWGAGWLSGGGGRAAGAVLVLPGVLTVAAVAFYPGGPPGASHGIVWVTPLLLALGVLGARWSASEQRRLVGRWSGAPIADPYLPLPASENGRWRRWRAATLSCATDRAAWRDVAWAAVTALAMGALVALLVCGPWLFDQLGPGDGFTKPKVLYAILFTTSPLWILWGAPVLLRLHERGARALIGPNRERELAARVQHLAETRAETVDHNAAELRRIERDLHDGAQARLVALGMALNGAEQLFDTDPAAARALLTEAKSASAKALVELRDLVRGIHPPVLADRGLDAAIHALALDLPLAVEISGGLATRPPAAVESAAYFAVSELLANTVKHAQARRAWIEIGHTETGPSQSVLRLVVTDDGRGGADPSRGSGLRGIERRLAAFDGVLAVSSPLGGPTLASLEIPCASPSPKTSSSSGTA